MGGKKQNSKDSKNRFEIDLESLNFKNFFYRKLQQLQNSVLVSRGFFFREPGATYAHHELNRCHNFRFFFDTEIRSASAPDRDTLNECRAEIASLKIFDKKMEQNSAKKLFF